MLNFDAILGFADVTTVRGDEKSPLHLAAGYRDVDYHLYGSGTSVSDVTLLLLFLHSIHLILNYPFNSNYFDLKG